MNLDSETIALLNPSLDEFDFVWLLEKARIDTVKKNLAHSAKRGKARPARCLYCDSPIAQPECRKVVRKYCNPTCSRRARDKVPFIKEKRCGACNKPIVGGTTRKKYCNVECKRQAYRQLSVPHVQK